MSSVGPGLPPRFDVFATEFLDDPYSVYERLRAGGALARAGPATWAVTRYAEVAALLRDERLGHALPDEMQGQFARRRIGTNKLADASALITSNSELTRIVSSFDPPEHTRVRTLMVQALSQSVGHHLEGWLRATANELLTRAIEHNRFDAVADFAQPLQITFACHLLGVPEADREAVVRQATGLGRAIILIPFVQDERGNGDTEARWLRQYVGELLKERRRAPGDDLISSMLLVRDRGRQLTDDEIIDNAVFFFFAGFETSIHLISSSLAALARFPDQWAHLRADRALVPHAVEEFLRYDAPLQWVSRITAQPIQIGGRTIRPGRLLLLLLGSANRDQRQFPNPNQLDVARNPNRHVSFGGGAHHCMGVLPVRAQGAIILEHLLERCFSLELADEPVLTPHPNIRSYASVPIIAKPM